MELEKSVEAYLVRRVRAAGGVCLKWTSPGMTGVPDRIVILPGGRCSFAEVKRPGEKPRPRQVYVIGQLRRLGCRVDVPDSREAVDRMMEELADGI